MKIGVCFYFCSFFSSKNFGNDSRHTEFRLKSRVFVCIRSHKLHGVFFFCPAAECLKEMQFWIHWLYSFAVQTYCSTATDAASNIHSEAIKTVSLSRWYFLEKCSILKQNDYVQNTVWCWTVGLNTLPIKKCGQR